MLKQRSSIQPWFFSLALTGPIVVGAIATVAWCQDAPAPAADAAPDALQRVDSLIDQLGADSFQQREAAMGDLIAIGTAVEPAVEAATESSDPEVAYRARKILKQIDRNMLAQRRAAFLEGDVDGMKLNAASWRRMEKLVGNTRQSRKLFLEMQAAAEDLLTAAEKDPSRCAQQISQLYTEDQQMRRFGGGGLPAGVVAAMVFIGSDEKVPLDASATSRCTSLLYRQRGTLGEDKVFRELLGDWINTKATGAQQYQFLRLTQQFKLTDEGVQLARKMIDGAAHTSYKAHALLTLGMLGGADDVKLMEKMIADDTRVGAVARSGKKRIECKLGDVALGMCLALSDQNAKDYGFPNAPNGRPTSTSYYNYGFVDDASRQAARQKWEAFKKQQPTGNKNAE